MAPRFFRHRELHLAVLALLAERPVHGYDLMHELGARFGPTYRPSAGSVYPALEALAAEGLIVGDGGDPQVFSPTPAGHEALQRRASDLAALEDRTGVRLGSVATVEAALSRLVDAARDAARGADADEIGRMLDHTRAGLQSLEPGP